ncbi:MAG TPA: substrate-binding domain-containing protein, partial [Mycobacteriales bacterium]|nr:substrate-binding domain-containing protein [Mycobacteriales bacterium]
MHGLPIARAIDIGPLGGMVRGRGRTALVTAGLLVAALVAGVVVGCAARHAPAATHASSTVTVVGTSDVYDSELMQKVITPDFEAAYPQYTLNYVSLGSGAAISYAEAGTASALLVHAAPLESRFVASGYSAQRFGRAVFYGDYVLLGPPSDPAHVFTNDRHDIVSAFEAVAHEAATHADVNFVSRG